MYNNCHVEFKPNHGNLIHHFIEHGSNYLLRFLQMHRLPSSTLQVKISVCLKIREREIFRTLRPAPFQIIILHYNNHNAIKL
jgi:hypothetical protein